MQLKYISGHFGLYHIDTTYVRSPNQAVHRPGPESGQ
jgi:hypothetical protein